MHQTLNLSALRLRINAQQEFYFCTSSSHCQSASDDSLDDLETSTEWKFERHLYFADGRWFAGKTHEDAVRSAVEEQYCITNCSCSAYQKEKFYYSTAEPDRKIAETADSRPCTGKIGEQMTVEVQLRWSEKRSRTPAGGIPLKCSYLTLNTSQ